MGELYFCLAGDKNSTRMSGMLGFMLDLISGAQMAAEIRQKIHKNVCLHTKMCRNIKHIFTGFFCSKFDVTEGLKSPHQKSALRKAVFDCLPTKIQ